MKRENLRPCACGMLQKTARCIARFYDRRLKSAGIRTSQYAMLASIRRAGPVSVGELGDILGMDQSTAVRNLSVLRQMGLIKTSPGGDARRKLATLTRRGEEKLAEALPHWKTAQRAIEDGLDADALEALAATARRIQELTAAD
ncbi:MAG: MarR family winged helix-turn-helix transcriptional regulator [Planctomycetota bacterium]|jgi:DNA-binding MarR family transcriptional regulator|nr:MarR family winged helix-turn-helix transcriptional regulator [Planctomycetota bacterium]